MSNHRFPNLFIIGAMKAGTSSLHEYLRQHPEIFMAHTGGRMKEISYFAPHVTDLGVPWGEGHRQPGLKWYLDLFADAGCVKYAGEASVLYTARPWLEDCEQRIYKFNPDARIIYILRDPIERAISHYWWNVRGGTEVRPMAQAVRQREDYIANSDYAMQLKPYLDRFGPAQVHVLTLESLQNEPRRTLIALFGWLGVNPEVSIDATEKLNVSKPVIRQTRRGLIPVDLLLKHWRWKRVEPRLPRFVPRFLHWMTYRQVSRENVNSGPVKDFLRPILQQRTRSLCELLGREFREWTTLFPPKLSAGQRDLEQINS